MTTTEPAPATAPRPVPAPAGPPATTALLAGLVDRFAGLPVLVVGETFLDGWLAGPSARLSREAPVPVVDVSGTSFDPGAAANTAVNLAALGASPRLLSVVGDDEDGARVVAALVERGVDVTDVLVERGRRTVAKRRVVAGGQMIVRLDTGDDRPVDRVCEDLLLARLTAAWPQVAAVVVGDYDAGLLGERVRARVAALHAGDPTTLVVDARQPRRWAPVRPTAVKPNVGELASLLDEADAVELRASVGRRDTVVARLAHVLLERAGADVVAATLDTEGGVLLQRGHAPVRLATSPAPHSRAAGAGDAFSAALSLALALGAPASDAGRVAAAAAAVTLRREGTSVATATELRHVLSGEVGDEGPVDLQRLAEVVAGHRAAGRRLVVTNGAFDGLHRGHVAFLRQAARLGDVLVVGLNSDEGLTSARGTPPRHPLPDRAAVLSALTVVDHVATFEEGTAHHLLEVVRPDVYVKGGDYTRAMLPEADLVERLGGRVQILDWTDEAVGDGGPWPASP